MTLAEQELWDTSLKTLRQIIEDQEKRGAITVHADRHLKFAFNILEDFSIVKKITSTKRG